MLHGLDCSLSKHSTLAIGFYLYNNWGPDLNKDMKFLTGSSTFNSMWQWTTHRYELKVSGLTWGQSRCKLVTIDFSHEEDNSKKPPARW